MNKLANILILTIALFLGGASTSYAQTSGPKIKGNVYGGGENAKVMGQKLNNAGNWVDDNDADARSTKISINNGTVEGNVYGAGKGVKIADVPTKDAEGNTITPALTYGQIATVTGDTEVNLTSFDAISDPDPAKFGTVEGNIYGGAALAVVEGNTHVNIGKRVIRKTTVGSKVVVDTLYYGGKFMRDVFGGGEGDVSGAQITSADVKNSTFVKVEAGEILWGKDNEGNFLVNDPIYHNIYAGGNIACTVGTWNNAGTSLEDEFAHTGTANLTMTRGLLGPDVLSSEAWRTIFAQHENPHFYAFGGGYGIYTKAHKSNVNILMPMVQSAAETGGDQQLARPRRAPGDPAPGGQTSLDLDIISDTYGVEWTTVLGVLGGGFNGHVEETDVLVGDATYTHRVYGGGLGSYEGWKEAGEPETIDQAALKIGKVGTVGPLSGDPSDTKPVAHVVIAGGHIHGDVFGGGAGVAPRKLNDSPAFTDFTEIARVKGNTLVETCSYRAYKYSLFLDSLAHYSDDQDYYGTLDMEKNLLVPNDYLAKSDLIQRGQVFGNVYGGGDVANVTGSTKVRFRGGHVFGQTFGAGLGRLTTEALNYKSIGYVTGNAEVEITDTIFVPKVTLTNLPSRLTTNVNVTDIVANQKPLSETPGDYICYFVVQDASTNPAIGVNFKPHAWDDIYGGGRNGLTGGDASVAIGGGYVGNNIFGGGLGNVSSTGDVTSADVLGNTNVTVTGGQYLWRQIADINGKIKNFNDVTEEFDRNVIDNKMMHQDLLEPVKDFFDYRTASYTRDHSIYGGGNIACKVGTYASDDILDGEGNITAPTSGGKATVDMQYGLFADTDIHWTDDDTWNLATLCRYLACENSSNYQFGIFGGGYGANTKVGETKVKLRMGEKEVIAEQASGDPTHYPSIWNTYMGTIHSWYESLSKQDQDDYYGGGVGANAENRYLTARMAHSINVPSHTVLTTAGGGLAGYVAGDTRVSLEQRSGALRIFGGGIGQRPTDTELASLNQDDANDMTYGQVGGDTNVDIAYGVVVKDVFGGGAGVEPLQNNSGNYVDFTNMARVNGKTYVKVHATNNVPTQTLVYGRVFGGGDVANVGQKGYEPGPETSMSYDRSIPRTKVEVESGCVFSDVFAGGSGRRKENCSGEDSEGFYGYQKLGAVYGNTQLVISQPNPASDDDNATWLWKDVYGGGQNGIVYGNTLVEIKGGWLGSNVFGGGLGYVGSKHNPATGQEEEVITEANVTQNTNVLVTGGQYCLSQAWNEVERNWHPMNKDDEGNSYSYQYDPIHNKFLIGHNIYGGGNVACTVFNHSYVDMNKGLIPAVNRLGHKDTENLFEEEEWQNIYNKHASPFFCVFGGGYGGRTVVTNDSYVSINIEGEKEPSDPELTAKPLDAIFADRQTLMDVIGGGYEGTVNHTCHVDIDGNTFMRNAFGGAYYASVGNTDVKVTRVNMDNVYGGGMMGDVTTNANVQIGTEVNTNDDAEVVKARNANLNLIINEDVYGANDVAGYVGAKSNAYGDVKITDDSEGVKIKLYGGHISGNVYGGGNGNYLYKIDDEVSQVTVEEDAEVDKGVTMTLYRVPLRISDFPSLSAMSDQQKMANVISYRPATMKTDIDFKGNSKTDRLQIDGNIFGGGNSATISDFDGADEGEDAHVRINVGSHIKVGGVFLGSDGEALFASQHGYMTYFPLVNDLKLYDHIDWTTPENQNIPIKFLPTPVEERPNIYKNNIDLYFMPVEMAVMPEVTWGKNRLNNSVWIARGKDDKDATYEYNAAVETEAEFTDAEIGTFCCGGNRGNMDTPTLFHINFPAGLTITENIIGGCNNANYTYNIPGQYDSDNNQLTLDHTGGFLLGTHGVGADHAPQINLTLRNKFLVKKGDDGLYPDKKCNVFGGCYNGGTVRGDIRVEVLSNMLMSGENGEGLDAIALRNSIDAKPSRTVCGVYGAGYGVDTWVYGDTDVRLGNASIACSYEDPSNNDNIFNSTGTSCNLIFGGGREGSVVGNTAVRVLNGHVASNVVGASYSGYLYGNSQVIVGYRNDYYVCQKSGKYHLNRVDDDPQHAYYVDANGKPVIKQDIWLTKGDLVAKASYEELDLTDADKTAWFTPSTYITYPDNKKGEWDKINIQIDKAIYGGGYALAGGGSVGAGSYTVRKYTNKYNLNEYAQDVYGLPEGVTLDDDNGSAAGGSPYGGNTFVMIGDYNNSDGNADKDHIKISSSQLRPITPKAGDNLFGKYYEVRHGTDTPKDDTDDFVTIEYVRVDRIYDPVSMVNERFYEYTGEGGIYGDGHLSLAEGFRLSDMLAYGYNGTAPIDAKLMNCIHRFDIVRLADCCFSLLGDRDYASTAGIAVDATPYSLANVGELKMISSIDKSSGYMDPLKNKRSRNYMGLSNRVTNVGAVYSDVSFEYDTFHHGNEGKYNDPEAKKEEYGVGNFSGLTYKEFKQRMIETYYDCANGKVKDDVPKAAINFQLRNDGTAKNLIGIGSGYALVVDYEFDRQKTQDNLTANSQNRIPDNQGIDRTYYGPVKGVFEVNLISVREGEAGGYVYAQNIHKTESYSGHDTHFLEASGNFVFPVTSQRKVIDDCYPVKYNSAHKHTTADGHYWYVTGLKYFYNATITGYTFDDQEMTFDMANSNLITLAGAKAGQEVWLEDFHIVNRHTEPGYACDFERDVNNDHTGYDLINQTDATDDSKEGKYMFSISTSKLSSYAESYKEGVNTINVPYLQTMQLNRLGEKQTNTKLSDNVLDVNDAPISIRITDNVNNNGKLPNGKSYYETYLSDPCQAVILLTVPAKDDNDFVVYNNDLFDQWSEDGSKPIDKVNVPRYYILNFDGTYLGVKDDEIDSYDTGEKRKLLYVLKDKRKLTADEMQAASPEANVTYYISDDDGKTFGEGFLGSTITNGNWADNEYKDKLYVVPTPVKYEYTIDLTIRYIKGPSHSGHIDIKNCALPGEMIRLSHEHVVIESDENSLPHNGNFWIIGPGKKVWEDPADDSKGWHWEFIDDYMGAQTRTGVDLLGQSGAKLHYSDPASRNLYYPYNPYIDDPKDNYRGRAYNTLMTEGMYHPNSAESKEYFLPAYYYMDGYVAQYCYTVQNINRVFRTEIQPVDTLCIHNYHRMLNANDMESNTGEKKIPHDLFVPWAAQYSDTAPIVDSENDDVQNEFEAQWKATHHRPRVYIEDANDLKAFKEYLARTEDTKMADLTILPSGSDGITQDVKYREVIKPASYAGANTDFILMADITVPDNWEPIANFNGALHGNGHVISGLGEKALFASLGENAHIYNLGLPTGRITTGDAHADNAKYHCCYTYNTGEKGGIAPNQYDIHTVYRKNGTADIHYTDDDWRYGRVAYDLNEFYLAERLDRGADDSDEHECDHHGYVESLYADGDYRYARYNLSPATSEYLRNDRTPLYAWGNDPVVTDLVDNDDDAHISKHDYEYDKEHNVLSHAVDESRAYYVNVGDPAEAVLSEYRPLIDEAKLNTAADPAPADKKNDYIFFGQTLNLSTVRAANNAVGTSLPSAITGVTHAVNDQANRIWRAYGFYQSKADDAFHFNKAAWALHPELTAIDFTGLHDVSPTHEWHEGYAPDPATAATSRIFYPMVMDMPDNLLSFDVMSNRNYNTNGTTRPYSNSNYGCVTQNLLVYNNDEKTAAGAAIFGSKDTEDITESAVLYHNLVLDNDAIAPTTKFSTNYLHLVDKQDFNAPIPFTVNTRAWYERTPSVFRNVSNTGESYATPSAWEGIILPFTAKKVTASENKEISHFYGKVPAEGVNMQTLHHEYWLTGMVAADGDKATFARPSTADAASEGLFTDETLGRQDYATNETPYVYPVNDYFTGLENYTQHHGTRNDTEWYAEAHNFENYVYLSKTVPYLISFPGNDYYEFSMQGTDYDTDSHSKSGVPQLVTFEHKGQVTIAVSDDETGTHTTTIGSRNHVGTYLHETGKHGVNTDGSAFSTDTHEVLPFRTYMDVTSSSAPRHIYINELMPDNLPHIDPEEPQPDEVIDQLTIYVEGMYLVVESPVEMHLPIYSVSGAKVANIHVQPGVTRTPFQPGIYIAHRHKYFIQ